jgi:signal transduction histidine kinase
MTSDEQELQKRIGALRTVQDIAQELMSERDPMRLLSRILRSAVEVLDADTGSLLIWVPPDHLEFAVSDQEQFVGQRMPADQDIVGWVFSNEAPVMARGTELDQQKYSERMDADHIQSLIAVPLMTATERLGVIEVLNKKTGGSFNNQDLDLLTALAAQAATAIVNARLYQELENEKNRLLTIEDQTHKKLARDLHDGPAQSLASMMMDIEVIGKLLEQEPERVPDELAQLRIKAGHTLAQIRTTMFVLRPVILETQGLKAALESYVERIQSTESQEVHLDVRALDEWLPEPVQEGCFAIVHEAVGNAIKHAHAKNVWIIVEQREEDLILAVRDDGEGFDVIQTEAGYDLSGSLGMLNMKERAEQLRAHYTLQSAPGRGTLIYLVVPLTTAPVRPRTVAARVDSIPRSPMAVAGKRRKGTGPLHLVSQSTSTAQESAPDPSA